MALDRITYLPDDLLTKVDRASMLHALEVRSPFMDPALVHFAAAQSTEELYGSSLSGRAFMQTRMNTPAKKMLREAFEADLPASVFKRPKMGFAVPIGRWFRGELRSLLRDTILTGDSFASGNLNMPAVQRLIDYHETEKADHSQRLYALLMLELWWREQLTSSAETR
jgi:asparagine synthase (glutamine-hydrolysing)